MNTCPNCGKVAGLHSSILQGCMCQYWKEHAQGLQRDYDSLLADFQAQRIWVGLTDEDKHEIELRAGITEDDDGYIVSQMFNLTEDKLKEKNT